jgi:hypothetical protein
MEEWIGKGLTDKLTDRHTKLCRNGRISIKVMKKWSGIHRHKWTDRQTSTKREAVRHMPHWADRRMHKRTHCLTYVQMDG